MKGKSCHITAYKIALIIMVVTIIGGIIAWQSNTDNYGNPESWAVFNESYQSPYRQFQFKYPPGFEVLDQSNAMAWLIKDNEFILGIDENHHLSGYSNKKNTAENQYKAYHNSRSWGETGPPDLTRYEKFTFGKNRFVYKSERRSISGFRVADHDEWIYYFGVLDGHGIEVYDLKKLPEEVVLEIIRSIEFE